MNALDLIKRFEGFSAKAYKCPAGVLTIGYGHTHNVKPGMRVTEAEAQNLLSEDLQYFERHLDRLVTVDLNANELAALLSLIYNIGVGAFEKSTLLKLLNQDERKAAADQFTKWSFANGKRLAGLLKRREAERELFLR